jgi:hypothetical protein
MASTKTCTGCDRELATKKFPADRRTKDGFGAMCIGCRSYAEEGLPTRDLDRVELMSEGGPYFGKGSPPEGDFFTREDLLEIADANRALAAEVVPANKLGHSKEQVILAQSGLGPNDAGEFPAAGWLDGETFEVVDGEDGKAKLIADVKRIPAKLASLFESGAFRKRSVELSKVTSQTLPGQTFSRVVTGLAWLGAKAPAIRTLDDVVALYTEDEDDRVDVAAALSQDEVPDDVEQTIDYAEGEIVWDAEQGYLARMRKIEEALNPGAADFDQMSYWVSDVTDSSALVSRNGTTWVVGWNTEDGRVTVAPASEWTVAEQAWVEAAGTTFQERARGFENRADTRGMSTTADEKTLTEEQIQSFATAFGIEEQDEAKRREAVIAKFAEHVPAAADTEPAADAPTPPTPPPNPNPTPTTPTPENPGVSLSSEEVAHLRMQAEKGEAAFEAARVEKRDSLITKAVEEGRLDPAKVETWRGFYDANADQTVLMLSELPVNDDLLRAYGSDADGDADGAEAGTAYAEDFESRFPGLKAVV